MRIFLSRPTWTPPTYKEGIDTFLVQLENLGLAPRTLGVSDYPSKSPLDEVIELIHSCQGAIILGVPQIEIQQALLKGNPIKKPLILGTEWNHLEAGLAYAAKLPLLVIHHETVTRGIFDRGVLNAFLHSVNLESNNWSMQPIINGALKRWKESCLKQPISQSASHTINRDKPYCPNCSSSGALFYLRPIPSDFVEIENAHFECSRCDYKE